jgi:hypothetical protein
MADVPDRLDQRELRASDADRERVATVLRDAAAQGRLGLDELDDRLGAVYAAKTYADLEPLTRDLPSAELLVPAPQTSVDVHIGSKPTSRGAIAVMSGFSRKGPWVPPRIFHCLAFWGGGTLDLRDARYADRNVKIRAFAIMGGVTVLVPEDAEVLVTGTGLMGGFDHSASGAGVPSGPRITVTGFAFWGGVGVLRRPSDSELKRRKIERRQRKLERRAVDDPADD